MEIENGVFHQITQGKLKGIKFIENGIELDKIQIKKDLHEILSKIYELEQINENCPKALALRWVIGNNVKL